MWPNPEITHFTIEAYDPPLPGENGGEPLLGTLTVFGHHFHIRALAPTITIGADTIHEYRITDDQCCLILFIRKTPEQAPIKIDFSGQTSSSQQSVQWPVPAGRS